MRGYLSDKWVTKQGDILLVRAPHSPRCRTPPPAAPTMSVAARKVAVLGAAGGIGQPLGLLMKMSPLVSQLSLYDIGASAEACERGEGGGAAPPDDARCGADRRAVRRPCCAEVSGRAVCVGRSVPGRGAWRTCAAAGGPSQRAAARVPPGAGAAWAAVQCRSIMIHRRVPAGRRRGTIAGRRWPRAQCSTPEGGRAGRRLLRCALLGRREDARALSG